MKPSSDDSPNTSKLISKPSRTFTIRELEPLAEKLLRDTFPFGKGIPIDIDFIAESHLGLEIFPIPGLEANYIPGLEANYNAFGALRKLGNDLYDIVVDKDILDYNINLYRFTLGEEIAHYVLHKEHFRCVVTAEQACALQRELAADMHHMERNAKWLSSALLMPSEDVKREANMVYGEIVKNVGFSNYDAIIGKLTDMLANPFRVSRSAMQYRLGNYPCKVTEAVQKSVRAHHADLWKIET